MTSNYHQSDNMSLFRTLRILAIIQFIIGILVVLIGIIAAVSNLKYHNDHLVFWSGCIIFVTGCVGIVVSAMRGNSCLVTLYLLMNIASIIVTLFSGIFGGIVVFITGLCAEQCSTSGRAVYITWLLLVTSAFAISVVVSMYCCMINRCCCCVSQESSGVVLGYHVQQQQQQPFVQHPGMHPGIHHPGMQPTGL